MFLTGVTGRIGSIAAARLLQQGHAVKGLARDPDKASALRAKGLEIVHGDLSDTRLLATALSGVDAALLVTSNNEAQLENEKGFSQAAADAGVSHLVKVSSIEVGPNARAEFPQIHTQSEEFIRSLGLNATMLRPNFYMQNLLMYARAISTSDSFTLPLGDAKTAMISAGDVGEIAANCLQSKVSGFVGHKLCGPELLDFNQVAERMSAALGRKITYQHQSHAEFKAFLSSIIPNTWHVDAVCELFEEISGGSLEITSPVARELLGRDLTTVEQFTQQYAQAFSPPA